MKKFMQIAGTKFLVALYLSVLMSFGTWQAIGQTGTGGQTDTNISRFSASMKIIQYELNLQPDRLSTFWERLSWAIEHNGPRNNSQRFGPMTKFLWAQWYENGDSQSMLESRGERVFGDTLSDSIIDAFTSGVDFDSLEKNRPVSAFSLKFIKGSLNTVEQHMEDTLQPNEIGLTKEFINMLFSDRTEYGANMLNANPYLFYARYFGHNRNNLPVLITNTRLRMMVLSNQIGTSRLDQEFLFPIDQQTQLSISCRIYPSKLNEVDWRPSMITRFTHEIGSGADKVFYASVRVEETERLFLVGVSLSWN